MDVEIEKPHVHHHRTGIPWYDLALPIAALFVSFISIYIAWHHGKVMQELVHQNEKLVEANSLPHLQLYGSNQTDSGERKVSLSVANQGIGPADIRSVQVKVDGRPVKTIAELLHACCATRNYSGITTSTLLGFMERPAQVIDYLSLREADNPELFRLLETARRARRIETDLCYCSVFDDCWLRTSRDGDRPVAVAQCPMPKPQYAE